VALAGTLALLGAGLLWWSLAPSADGDIVTSFVLPGMVRSFGAGAGIVAGYVVCTAGVEGPAAASGLVNTTLRVGGAIGVAVFSTVSAAHLHPASGNATALASGIALAALGVALALRAAR
jgi:hypothetical protein